MSTIDRRKALWDKLAASREYRRAFAASAAKRWIPFQIRVMRDKRGWNQAELAQLSQLTQGAISRAENPQYGNLTINTLVKIAAGFDCAFEVRFIPFKRLANTFVDMSEGSAAVPSFTDEAPIDSQCSVVSAPPEITLNSPAVTDSVHHLPISENKVEVVLLPPGNSSNYFSVRNQ